MTIRIIRSRDHVRTPWKNGGGTTAEVVVAPPGADFDHFDWRISMADVTSPGPFSAFPGIARTLALIEGASLDLDVDGVTHRLDAASPLLNFAGESQISARLPTGPIRNLNVMTRRNRFQHRMRYIPAKGVLDWKSAGVLAIVAIKEASVVTLDSQIYRLDRLDVLVAEPFAGTATSECPIIAIDFIAR